VCFSNDIQTVMIPRRRVSASSTTAADDDSHRQSTSRPVNRQLELPGHQVKGHGNEVKGRLRSSLSSAAGPSRVSDHCVFGVNHIINESISRQSDKR